jgi:hypothetical protein
MPNHILRNVDLFVILAVMHVEREADKVGQNRSGSGLGLDRRDLFARLGALDRKSLDAAGAVVRDGVASGH